MSGSKKATMIDKYSHRERVRMIMAGEKPDRFAASVWRHFYHRETSAENLSEAMLDFQKKYDWDFMKINPRASYHVEDWGNRMEWSTNEFEKHRKVEFAVKKIDDWDKIDILPTESPILSEHLRAVELIKKKSDRELPLFMTIFNPIGIARYLVGDKNKLLEHMAEAPDKVSGALERITVTFEKFAAETRQAGADGLFYATLEWASSDLMTCEHYENLVRPLDIRIIEAAGDDALNILHVCGSNNYLRRLSDYPVHLINWEANDPTNINLDDAFDFMGDKTVVAGLDDRGWLHYSKSREIAHEISRLKEKMSGKKFIFGPGCAVDPHIPAENLMTVRENL